MYEVVRLARELGIQKPNVAVVLGDDVLAHIQDHDLPLMEKIGRAHV